jgi:hypothetical protein
MAKLGTGFTEQELRDAQVNKLNLELKALSLSQKWYLAILQRFARWLLRNATILTLIIALSGVFIGLWQYKKTTERDFKRAFWEKQLNLYMELTGATATLVAFSADKDPVAIQEYQKARVKFWELYYGELAVIADPNVDKEMVDFGYCFRLIEIGDRRCDPVDLKPKALSLAAACRASVSNSWKQDLGTITERRETEIKLSNK